MRLQAVHRRHRGLFEQPYHPVNTALTREIWLTWSISNQIINIDKLFDLLLNTDRPTFACISERSLQIDRITRELHNRHLPYSRLKCWLSGCWDIIFHMVTTMSCSTFVVWFAEVAVQAQTIENAHMLWSNCKCILVQSVWLHQPLNKLNHKGNSF